MLDFPLDIQDHSRTAGRATIFVMGSVLTLIYRWWRSLLAPMILHFLQDFVGIVLVPPPGLKWGVQWSV